MNTSVSDKNTQGFTIIELLMVLAITGLLMMITFFGQGSIRSQSQFRDSVEDFRASMESIKDQSTAGVSAGSTGCNPLAAAGTNEQCVIYGRVVEFTNETEDYKVTPVVGDRPADKLDATKPVSNPKPFNAGVEDKKLLWGTQFYFAPPVPSIIPKVGFIRHAANGPYRNIQNRCSRSY